jgi:CPA2 family monovalent cation:H+ antiporter-2
MQLFVVLLAALVGGYIAKKLKFQPIIGYIVAGVATRAFLPFDSFEVEKLAELGSILLLFSIGLELSINKFGKMFSKIIIASIAQMVLVSIVMFFVLKIFGQTNITALVLGLGFSLSSTAIVVKTLIDRGETETIHGKLMIGWLLVQDLAVIPMMVILPVLANSQGSFLSLGLIAVLKSFAVIVFSVILGKHIVPFLIHKIAILNSRELMVLSSVAFAVGTAAAVSLFGISASLGAFIAGFVISESQENHAVFAETRPLRDLFVALFFVTLGFLVNFRDIISNFWLILEITSLVILIKIVIVAAVSYLLKIKGKTAIISAFGLSQIGEFSFILFSSASLLKLIPQSVASMGVAISLLTLIITPFVYKLAVPTWRWLSARFNFFSSYERNNSDSSEMTNHIIICGFGRVGGWVGKALNDHGIEFVVVDLDPKIVQECLDKGIKAIHGDPIEREVLKIAGVENAKAVIVAIPDRMSQESIIAHIQTMSPNTKIISRVHLDEDYEKLKNLRVDKIVQPEFEAAASIIKNILVSMGKDTEDINKSIKSLRLSHAKI